MVHIRRPQPHPQAEVLLAVALVASVLFGGMVATTWVQIIKAVLLMLGAAMLSVLVLKHHGYSLTTFFNAISAATYGGTFLSVKNTSGSALTMSLDATTRSQASTTGKGPRSRSHLARSIPSMYSMMNTNRSPQSTASKEVTMCG